MTRRGPADLPSGPGKLDLKPARTTAGGGGLPVLGRAALIASVTASEVRAVRACLLPLRSALMAAQRASRKISCTCGRDQRMKQVLKAQDGLYTLVLKHSDGTYEPRVIGSIVEYLYAPDDPEAVIEKMAAPTTRIVSLTITEGGYNVSDLTGEFDVNNPAVVADLEPGSVLRTTFGLVTEALRARGRPGPHVPGLPARLHERGGHPHPAPGARGRPRQVQRTLIERFSNP